MHLHWQTPGQERGGEGPSWEQERGGGEGTVKEGSGRRARTGASQHLWDPMASLPPASCARQPLLDAHHGDAGERLWSGCIHPHAVASLCLPGPKGETQARKHLHS